MASAAAAAKPVAAAAAATPSWQLPGMLSYRYRTAPTWYGSQGPSGTVSPLGVDASFDHYDDANQMKTKAMGAIKKFTEAIGGKEATEIAPSPSPPAADCYGQHGYGTVGQLYRGKLAVTQGGKQCQPWALQSPHAHPFSPTAFPGEGLDGAYCRNPDRDEHPWCYTMDGGTRWQRCDVCSAATVSDEAPRAPSPPAILDDETYDWWKCLQVGSWGCAWLLVFKQIWAKMQAIFGFVVAISATSRICAGARSRDALDTKSQGAEAGVPRDSDMEPIQGIEGLTSENALMGKEYWAPAASAAGPYLAADKLAAAAAMPS